jgi:hypothetical protein
MTRAVLQACLPWLTALAVLLLAAWAIVRFSGGRFRLGRLRRLHGDETGGVQSLSFVITMPFFVMLMVSILQISQIIIGVIVVHYAAYATARSASVWIPANLPVPEGSNCISSYFPDPTVPDQIIPIVDSTDEQYGPGGGGVTYLVEPGSLKYEKIFSAAVLACTPVSPSKNLGFDVPNDFEVLGVLQRAYGAIAPESNLNPAVSRRLANKFAYALNNTDVEIRFFHDNREPPLVTYLLGEDDAQYRFNEIGWQDQITVKVKYRMALLPGPGRFFAQYVLGPGQGSQRVVQVDTGQEKFYAIGMEAQATIGNEGEKSMIPYGYYAY